MKSLPNSYQMRLGSGLDRALLLNFLYQTYQELFEQQNSFSHLAGTVDHYFCSETPLWWVESEQKSPIACLWMGQGIDQISGDRYGHIFLLYVAPQHRRQGIATVLLQQAQLWVQKKDKNKSVYKSFTITKPPLTSINAWVFRRNPY